MLHLFVRRKLYLFLIYNLYHNLLVLPVALTGFKYIYHAIFLKKHIKTVKGRHWKIEKKSEKY